MKPKILVDQAKTADGEDLFLFQHDNDFYIHIDQSELMSSRRHESELELGRIGCQKISSNSSPARVLIGGLGMGYTLRAALDSLPANAEIVMVELLDDIIRWNRETIGQLAGHPLNDSRVTLLHRNVGHVITEATADFDAILLDIDNGPEALAASANGSIYGKAGIQRMVKALKPDGMFSLWTAVVHRSFERHLERAGLTVERHAVRAYKNGKDRPHFVITARP